MEAEQQIYSVTDADFIENEEFDFDLPVSPLVTSSTEVADGIKEPDESPEDVEEEDEDEVFFGPVGFKEKCVAKKTELRTDSPDACKPMSPLTTEQYVEIFKEATKVTLLLKNADEEKNDKSNASVDQLAVSVSELALKSKSEENTTPSKSEMQLFKRAVKKDLRSPRRGTYTISVSPAGQPPPPHLPTAKECVSTLAKDQPAEIKFTAKNVPEGKPKQKPVAAAKKSRLPAKRSGIPKTSGLRKPKPVLPNVGTKKQQSPPKRTRLASGESCEGLATIVPGSPVPTASDMSENGLCSGKRRIPGSNNPLKKGLFKSSGASSTNKSNASSKLPSKLSLLKPGAVPRKTLTAARPSKLAKPGSLPSKLQPIKATVEVSTKKIAAAKPVAANKLTTPKVQTPYRTPVVETKNVVPKRILSSGSFSATKHITPRTTRSYSVDSAIKSKNNNNSKQPPAKTPVRNKPSLPGTPQRSTQKGPVNSSVTGSSRRRSGIPTPMKRSVSSSTSRLSSTSSVRSHQSPARTLPTHVPKTRIPSPVETPPAPQISPALPTESARQDNSGASPELAAVPSHKKLGRAALHQIQEKSMPSPQIDLLIKLDTPSPMQNKGPVGSLLDMDDAAALNKKCLTPLALNPAAKENHNLIDLL